ncbi:MAG: glycosyltransferase family 2 protein [Candidatus Omnitrophica bacterium]|nr:glycosyltransferase family 2 protein [Candidatus Omnitrophota bacterium]
MKVCVLIPAYNEESTIASLVQEIKSNGFDPIVVDDGSTDNTALKAKESQALVLSHPSNLGKGQALRTGFKYIRGGEYDAVVIMDADGQHLASEISKFIAHAKKSKAGIIIGNRMQSPVGMPLVRKITNYLTSYIISKLISVNIPDSQCGFRLIKTEVLKKLNLSTMKYEIESEILIEAAKNNFLIESIPVKAIYANQKSQINPVVDTIRFCNLISRNIFGKN